MGSRHKPFFTGSEPLPNILFWFRGLVISFQSLTMASSTLLRRFTPHCKLVRTSHTGPGSNLTGNFPLNAKPASFGVLEEDYIEKSDIHGLDYESVMTKILQGDVFPWPALIWRGPHLYSTPYTDT